MTTPLGTKLILRPGQIVFCKNDSCGRAMAGKETAKTMKISQHGAHGLCSPCLSKMRRDGKSIAEAGLIGEHLNTPLGRDWREYAACGDADPTLFEERTFSGPIKRLPEEILATAYRYCQRCPVLDQCKAEADANPALRGLLGGVYRTLNLHTRKGQRSYRRFDLLSPDYDPEPYVHNRVDHEEKVSVSTSG